MAQGRYLVYACLAIVIFPFTSIASPKVVSFDLTKREIIGDSLVENKLRRRAKSVAATLYNAQSNLLYLVNATIGSPGQQFSLQLDTGSSDIWIPSAGSSACTGRTKRCVNGAYDESKSSTYADVGQDEFLISYVDKTKIAGDYINETFGIGGITLQQMTMGLARQSSEPDTTSPFQGIVGVGFDTGEAIFSQAGITYPNIISQLQLQGFINTRAYSLWLNDRGKFTSGYHFGFFLFWNCLLISE
jgi:hypothetical protein